MVIYKINCICIGDEEICAHYGFGTLCIEDIKANYITLRSITSEEVFKRFPQLTDFERNFIVLLEKYIKLFKENERLRSNSVVKN